jgi:hypothetical protein
MSSLRLLIDGFLTDSDVFKSFGFEHLYERGYLSFEHWNAFQHRQFKNDIALLEDAYDFGVSALSSRDLDDIVYSQTQSHPYTFDIDRLQTTPDGIVPGANPDLWPTDSPKMRDELHRFPDMHFGRSSRPESVLSGSTILNSFGESTSLSPSPPDTNPLAKVFRDAASTLTYQSLVNEIESGNEDAVKYIIDHDPHFDPGDVESRRVLRTAILAGQEPIVSLLLSKGVCNNSNSLDSWLITVADIGYESIARLFLDHGANIDTATNNGWTPLLLAASEGQEGCIRLLLDRGANIDAANKNGETSLEQSAIHDNPSFLRRALRAGFVNWKVSCQSKIKVSCCFSLVRQSDKL